MPSKDKTVGRAEMNFREAFERLKKGKPLVMPKGTPPSQNNVAKEAGVIPSALRASRFPLLVQEIKDWNDENGGGEAAAVGPIGRRAPKRAAKQFDQDLKKQRDQAQARLVQAELRIVELTIENARLRALQAPRKVTPLRSDGG